MARVIRAPRGTAISCKSWLQEAALRMLMNNLDPDVAEDPAHLIVYGGRGRAARSWEAFDAIVESLRALENDETLLVQSGKPVAVFRTHPDAPRVPARRRRSGARGLRPRRGQGCSSTCAGLLLAASFCSLWQYHGVHESRGPCSTILL